MYPTNCVVQPESLIIGEKYKMKTENSDKYPPAYEEVIFLSYTSSPEIVIVQMRTSQKLRVPRGKIYEIHKNN